MLTHYLKESRAFLAALAWRKVYTHIGHSQADGLKPGADPKGERWRLDGERMLPMNGQKAK